MTSATDLVQDLAERARELLRGCLGGRTPYALVDFPSHSNVGDSAIWLGELSALRGLGLGLPHYVCDAKSFSVEAMHDRIGDGPVLIHGGGNLGDLWPRHQLFREEVIRKSSNNPVIQLPQSVEFTDEAAQRRAREVFKAHPDLTILVRDHRSLDRMSRHFDTEALLCPDLAFCIDVPKVEVPLRAPIRWLLRTDHESSATAGQVPEGAEVLDWLEEPDEGWVRLSRRGHRLAGIRGALGGVSQPLLRRAWAAAARQRLCRGIEVLGGGEVVITDRLHAHVLCLLLGIPHVVIPDRYGKIESFIETWTSGAALLELADDPWKAEELAEGLLRRKREDDEAGT